MKKLMTILSVTAVAAFAVGAANGDTLNTGTGFESASYIAGENLDPNKDDNGNSAELETVVWGIGTDTLEDGVATVTAYGGEGAAVAADVAAATGVATDDLGSNYLKLESAPLISRYAQAGGTAVDIGDGLYIDTLVQFSAADPETPPTPDNDGGDKLCIWLADNEEDSTQCTLMVTAGFVADQYALEVVATNYETTTKLENNSWHRLQVKVLKQVDGDDGILSDAFVVFIDGVAVATQTSPINSEFFEEITSYLTPRAAVYISQNSYSLFPSLIKRGDDDGTITSLSFQGSGAVDNIAFTQGADIDPILIPQALEPVQNGTEFTHTGSEIEAVSYPEGAYGYEFEAESNIGTEVGSYKTTATPLYGYAWFDGSTTSKTYDWEIVSGGEPGEKWADTSDAEAMAEIAGKTAEQAYGITGAIAAADATQLTVWATGVGSVAFSDASSINTDCFLLNIANSASAEAIAAAKAEFKVSIKWNDTKNDWDITTLPVSKTYNGTLTLKGSTDLTVPKANWDAKAAGDTFFYATLGL